MRRSRRLDHCALVGFLFLVVAAAACRTEPATQIVVVVATDMRQEILDGFVTRVRDKNDRERIERRFLRGTSPPAVALPADFAIGPKNGDATRRVTVEVEALRGDEVLFRTHASTTFRAGRSLRLDMFLASRCLTESLRCDADERCTENGCVPAEVDPDDLPSFGGSVDGGGWEPWVRLSSAQLVDVALDEDGSVFVLGTYTANATLDGMAEPLPTVAGSALLLAHYAATGELLWTVVYTGANVTPADLAISDHLEVVGNFANTFDFGDGPQVQPVVAGFHAHYSKVDGSSWQQTAVFASDISSSAVALAPGADGVTAIVGTFLNDVDLGFNQPGGDLDPGDGSHQFLALLDADGAFHCADYPPRAAEGWSTAQGIAFASSGPVVLGEFGGEITLPSGSRTADGVDGYLIGYDADCQPIWDMVMGGRVDQLPTALAVSDEVAMATGATYGSISVNDQVYERTNPDSARLDFFAIRHPIGREDVTVSVFGGSSDDLAYTVAPIAGGSFLLGGGLESADAQFAGSPIELLGARDGFVARFDAEGPQGLRQIGGGGLVLVTRVASSSSTGVAAATGTLVGQTDFEGLVRDGGTGSYFLWLFRP